MFKRSETDVSILTQCTLCHTIFRVPHSVLEKSYGLAKCGVCGMAFNAIQAQLPEINSTDPATIPHENPIHHSSTSQEDEYTDSSTDEVIPHNIEPSQLGVETQNSLDTNFGYFIEENPTDQYTTTEYQPDDAAIQNVTFGTNEPQTILADIEAHTIDPAHEALTAQAQHDENALQEQEQEQDSQDMAIENVLHSDALLPHPVLPTYESDAQELLRQTNELNLPPFSTLPLTQDTNQLTHDEEALLVTVDFTAPTTPIHETRPNLNEVSSPITEQHLTTETTSLPLISELDFILDSTPNSLDSVNAVTQHLPEINDASLGTVTSTLDNSPISFKQHSTRHTILFAVISIGLLLLGVGQVIWQEKDIIAVSYPMLRSPLDDLCAQLNCHIALPHDINALKISSSEFSADKNNPQLFHLYLTVSNLSGLPTAYPSFSVDLENDAGELLSRKIISPLDYLSIQNSLIHGIAAKQDWNISLSLNAANLNVSNYKVLLFYPH